MGFLIFCFKNISEVSSGSGNFFLLQSQAGQAGKGGNIPTENQGSLFTLAMLLLLSLLIKAPVWIYWVNASFWKAWRMQDKSPGRWSQEGRLKSLYNLWEVWHQSEELIHKKVMKEQQLRSKKCCTLSDQKSMEDWRNGSHSLWLQAASQWPSVHILNS